MAKARREYSERTPERREAVERCLVLHLSPPQIVKRLKGEFPAITLAKVHRDISTIHSQWERIAALDRPHRRHKMRHTLGYILQRSMADGDWKSALTACKELCDLDGLKAPVRVETAHTIEHKVQLMTSDERRKRMREIIRARMPEHMRSVLDAPGLNGANGANGANGGANGNGAAH